MTRKINTIIVHCSDSKTGNAREIDRWHKKRGWLGIGYHFVILNGKLPDGAHLKQLDGSIECGRSLKVMGAHARGHNSTSVGICLIGTTSYTIAQLRALIALVAELKGAYGPATKVLGHCELPGVRKTCPNLDMDALRRLIRSSEGR